MVLLKNDGNLLPLDKGKIKSIAVIGPDAHPGQPVGGGSGEVRPFSTVSFLEGIANYLGSGAKCITRLDCRRLSELAGQTHFTTEANGGKAGLKAEFFDNTGLSGKPGIERIDDKPATILERLMAWRRMTQSIRWTGYFTPSYSG